MLIVAQMKIVYAQRFLLSSGFFLLVASQSLMHCREAAAHTTATAALQNKHIKRRLDVLMSYNSLTCRALLHMRAFERERSQTSGSSTAFARNLISDLQQTRRRQRQHNSHFC